MPAAPLPNRLIKTQIPIKGAPFLLFRRTNGSKDVTEKTLIATAVTVQLHVLMKALGKTKRNKNGAFVMNPAKKLQVYIYFFVYR